MNKREHWNSKIFDSSHLGKNLAGKSVLGGITTLGSQGVFFVLRLASTMVLARMLTPVDFGLIAMVMVVVKFAVMFKDVGLSMATVQKEEITHEQISTLFWINVLLSTGLGVCILIASPLVAMFYGKPELTPVTAALSFSFVLSGLTLQHRALQRRHMRFVALAGIQIASQVISLIVTIVLAWIGWRYWALVSGALCQALASSLLTFAVFPWIPGRMKKGTGVRDMLKFGGHLTAFDFINYFSRNADNMLIGRFLGADALGLYSKAYQIVYLPLQNVRNPVNAVALPVLSKLQNDPERFRRYYRKIVFILAFFSMPLMAFCIMFPEELIRLVFGEQWLGMKTAFRLLAIAGYAQTVTGTRGMLLLACGHPQTYLVLGTVGAFLTVAGFGMGLFWGITGVAASFVVTSYAMQYHMFSYTFRITPCTFSDLLGSCAYPMVFSWMSVLFSWGMAHWFPILEHWTFLAAALLMAAMYVGLFLGLPPARRQFLETISLLRANRRTGT